MIFSEQNSHEEKRLLDTLTDDYENLFCISVSEDGDYTDVIAYGEHTEHTELIMELFRGDEERFLNKSYSSINLPKEERKELWDKTRYSVILSNFEINPIYYVFFRVYFDNAVKYYKLKITQDCKGGKPYGIAVAFIRNEIGERFIQHQMGMLHQNLEDAERTIMERTAELRDLTLALSFANNETIELLGNILEFRNKESGLHVKRVKAFTRVLAQKMMERCPEYKLTNENVDCITTVSSLHDVGKILIPDAILFKKGSLTPEEKKIMQKHCEYGFEVLSSAPRSWTPLFTKTALDVCYCHHEKWDGSGYPRGLMGDDIPISAQIVSVADCYDALTTRRIYKPASSAEEAYNMIMRGECGVFSDRILKCLALCKESYAEIVAEPDKFCARNTVQISGSNKLKGLNILLVDDSEISLELDKDILENEGANVTTAMNGLQAIEKFTAFDSFDAIIMDIVMPEMDGIEATRRIRALEGSNINHVPIIALTSEDSADKTLLEVGINARMAKPLIVGELTRILVSLLHNSSILMQKQLAETLKIANTDTLTKVKSIAAYMDMVSSLNNEIKGKNKPDFSIVMCDINGLKHVNDTYGHETGNTYIINCCKLLSAEFRHSPIYRIGGDEFVVVLQGEDYSNRQDIMKSLCDKLKESERISTYYDGKTSFAVGMADYDPLKDTEVAEVQERADGYMYINKQDRKRR